MWTFARRRPSAAIVVSFGPKQQARSQVPAKRDQFIDGIRGLFHIILMLDHMTFLLPGMVTLLGGFYESAGYLSVAEGFVFVSGFISGVVYTKTRREKGNGALWR